MKKRIVISIMLAFILALMLSLSAAASTAPYRLVDNENVLSTDEETALTQKLDSLSTELEIDIAVVTVKSFGNKTPQAYADDYFDYNGYGYGADDSGIILVVSMTQRKYAISTHADAIDIFDDRALDELVAAFKPHLSADRPYDALNAFADKTSDIIRESRIEAPNPKYLNPVVWIPVSLIIGAAVAVTVILLMKRKHKSVKMQTGADTYMMSDTFRLERSRDVFLFSTVSRIAKPKSNSGGRHRSSSGRSHGGRSGGF